MAISVGVTANGGDFTQIYNMQDATDNDADGGTFSTLGQTNTTIFVEGTASIPYQAKSVTNAAGWAGMWNSANNIDISNNHLRIAVSSLDPFQTEGYTSGGINIRISQDQGGAGNYGEWEVGGQDTLRVKIDNFIHLCVDTSRTYDRTAGTPSLTSCDGFYGGGTMQSGSGQNTFLVDNISYGEKIQVYGGGVSTQGNSSELAAVTAVREHGAFLDVGGIYYVLAGMDIGETGTASSYFFDENQTWNFQGQNVSATLYTITFEGNATGTNSCKFGTKSGTGKTATGSGGNTFKATQEAFNFVITDSNFDEPYFYGCSFQNAGTTSGTFNITNANAEFVSCSFVECAKITLDNSPLFVNNTVDNSTVLSTEAAIDLGTTKPTTNTFANITQAGCNAHGLRVSGTSTVGDTWTFDNIVLGSNTTADFLVDYPAQTGGNKVYLDLVNGAAANSTTQIAVTGGIALADVVIRNNVQVTFDQMRDNTEVRIYENITEENTDISFTATNTISSASSGFGDFAADDIIRVSGSGANDGTYTLVTASATTLTVTPATIATESAGATVKIKKTNQVELAGIEDATAGSADNRNFAASLSASTIVDYILHNFQTGDEIYQTIRVNGFTWPTTAQTIIVQQQLDRNAEN